jgi:hypothetical protein
MGGVLGLPDATQGVSVFQFAETVEDAAWENEKAQEQLQACQFWHQA